MVQAAVNIGEDSLELDSISSPVNLSLGPLEAPPSRSGKSTKMRYDGKPHPLTTPTKLLV